MEKVCFRCGVLRPLTEFYKHKEMADGHLNKCKTCTKGDSNKTFHTKKHIPEWKESERVRATDKYKRLYRESLKPYSEKVVYDNTYEERYPEKYKAKIKMQRKSIDGYHHHHWSYNDIHLEDVITLTIEDHYIVHRHIMYDPVELKYRKIDGILLDTRELHEQFINEILNDPSTV